jgi:hypothetical protein
MVFREDGMVDSGGDITAAANTTNAGTVDESGMTQKGARARPGEGGAK